MKDFFHPPYYYGNKMGRISDITSDIFRMGSTTGYIATGLLLLLLRIILRGIHTTDISNPVVCEISPHIYIYMWLLIKIPLSASGHSARINMLLSRIFRELHVYLSQSKLFTRTFRSITMYYIHISYGLSVSIICVCIYIYIYMWIHTYI